MCLTLNSIMTYEKLVSVDGIEFISLRKPEQTNIETKQEQIDIEAQNTLEDKSTTCCICLENNNETSVEFKCRCRIKIHSACLKEMKKNRITKCPICYDSINKSQESIMGNLRLIFILCLILLFTGDGIVNFYYILPSVIFYPSVFNYCDNIYRKCEYYKVHGKLINNTITVNVKNFIPKYNLMSTYEYEENEKCINIDYHKYTSFEDIQIVKEKTINTEKNIFVSYLDKSKCKDNYEYYNPLMLYTKFFGVINLISMGVSELFIKYHDYSIENNYNVIFKFFLLVFKVAFNINYVITTFISSYYNFFLIYRTLNNLNT